MSIVDYFKSEQEIKQSEKSRCLEETQAWLLPSKQMAIAALPEIESALFEYDTWVRDNIGVPAVELPADLSDLAEPMLSVEAMRNNLNVIRGALKEADRLREQDVWGARPDGARDINKAPSVRQNIRAQLNHANGCATSIRRNLERLKAKAKQCEDRREYRRLIEANETAQPVTIRPPEKKAEADKITVNKEINVREIDGQ